MHYDILTSDLIQRAAQLARSLGHSYVGSAHLLLVMAREPGAVGQTLRLLGMDPDLTEAMARLLYGQGTPELPLPQGLTGESRELLRGAAREAKHLGSREITPQHLLLAMARRENSDAYELLKLNGISTDELFTHAVDYLHWEQGAPVRGKKEAVTTKLLEQFSEDLILKASGMDPVIGREREIDTVIGILCRKNKNNPALVGEPGVGKTAIAEGLAQLVHDPPLQQPAGEDGGEGIRHDLRRFFVVAADAGVKGVGHPNRKGCAGLVDRPVGSALHKRQSGGADQDQRQTQQPHPLRLMEKVVQQYEGVPPLLFRFFGFHSSLPISRSHRNRSCHSGRNDCTCRSRRSSGRWTAALRRRC